MHAFNTSCSGYVASYTYVVREKHLKVAQAFSMHSNIRETQTIFLDAVAITVTSLWNESYVINRYISYLTLNHV